MISNRLRFMKDADLRGELLQIINAWHDDVQWGEYGIDEQDRLKLMDTLVDYLAGKRG